MRATVQHNGDKFRELLVYIASKTGDDPRFGDIKLNKVLWFADFRAYRDLGHAITGARYQKLELGPAARAFMPVRDELVAEGALQVQTVPAGPTMTRTETVALREPHLDLFDDAELKIVDEVIEWLAPKWAMSVSDLSHTAPGWNMVALQDDIPYETALLSTSPPSERTIRRGRELAARFGW